MLIFAHLLGGHLGNFSQCKAGKYFLVKCALSFPIPKHCTGGQVASEFLLLPFLYILLIRSLAAASILINGLDQKTSLLNDWVLLLISHPHHTSPISLHELKYMRLSGYRVICFVIAKNLLLPTGMESEIDTYFTFKWSCK